MTKLIRWETPFTEARCPSVGLLITSKGIEVDILKAVVAPGGIDEYPKYLVDFGRVIAFTCFEEAHSPERGFYHTGDTPVSFAHYVIFGGDNNVEVITPDTPAVEVIEEKIVLKIEYEL